MSSAATIPVAHTEGSHIFSDGGGHLRVEHSALEHRVPSDLSVTGLHISGGLDSVTVNDVSITLKNARSVQGISVTASSTANLFTSDVRVNISDVVGSGATGINLNGASFTADNLSVSIRDVTQGHGIFDEVGSRLAISNADINITRRRTDLEAIFGIGVSMKDSFGHLDEFSIEATGFAFDNVGIEMMSASVTLRSGDVTAGGGGNRNTALRALEPRYGGNNLPDVDNVTAVAFATGGQSSGAEGFAVAIGPFSSNLFVKDSFFSATQCDAQFPNNCIAYVESGKPNDSSQTLFIDTGFNAKTPIASGPQFKCILSYDRHIKVQLNDDCSRP